MTTFGLKAECGRFIEYDSDSDLIDLWREGVLKDALHLGGGSNLLFTTGHISHTVIHCRDNSYSLSEPDTDGYVTLHASAGCILDDLCAATVALNLWGMENLSGIPGEIGGAAVQNVGAYGTEFRDIALSVDIFDTVKGEFSTLSGEECCYGYRDSLFKHTDAGKYIITGATLRLSTKPTPRLGYSALKEIISHITDDNLTPAFLREKVIELRDSKLPSPAVTGSAGSFFKNPVISLAEYKRLCLETDRELPAHITPSGEAKLSAAWLIDNAGCKPMTCGGAALWHTQPLVIVNATGDATGNDVVRLEEMIRKRVLATFGIDLIPEVIHI